MGCDIHLYAEVRRDGNWEKVGRIWPNRRWEDGRSIIEDDEGYYFGPMTDQPYQGGRGYGLFGILAGVRAREIVSIGAPRGIPDDASGETRALADRWGSDGHSYSWWTVAELIAWPCWQMIVAVESDYNDPVWDKQFKQHTERGKQALTEADKAAGSQAFMGLMERIPRRPWTAAAIAGPFYNETLPALLDLGAPDDVRIVFWFDN